VLLVAGVLSWSREGVADSFSRDFLRALRNAVDDDPEIRRGGERALRQLGQRTLRELDRWVALAERRLQRARELAADLRGEGPESESPRPDAVRRFFIEQLELGWARLQDGDYRKAQDIAGSLLCLDEDSPLLFDYRRLQRAAEKRVLATEVLQPLAEFGQQVYALGQTPTLRFRLINHRKEQLLLHADRGVLGVLTVRLEWRLPDGTRHESVSDHPIETFRRTESWVVPAESAKEITIPLRIGDSLPQTGVVARLFVTGRFRPSRWGIEGRNVNHVLEIPRVECWLVPADSVEVARAPLRKLKMALLLKDFPGFFVSGQLAVWASLEDPLLKERLLELLGRSLEYVDAVGLNLADHFLSEATGIESAPRGAGAREFWEEWLASKAQTAPAGGAAERGASDLEATLGVERVRPERR
jgi:hypothetical protein